MPILEGAAGAVRSHPLLCAVAVAVWGALLSLQGVAAQQPGGSPSPTPQVIVGTLSPRDAALASSTGPVLYTRGDHFVVHPVEGCAVFVTMILVAAFVELLIDKVKAIKSEYFQLVLSTIMQETQIVGIMTLLLIFVITLGELRIKWVILMNYAVMALLFMVISFVLIITACAVVLRVQTARWRDFEGGRIDSDPLLTRREVLFKNCRDRFRESVAASADVKYYPQMRFSDYVRRVEKYTVSRIADLSWKAWGMLSLLVVMNGVRARISMGSSATSGDMTRQERVVNIVSYVIFVGYGPLMVFAILYFLLHSRLSAFAEKPVVTIDPQTKEIEVAKSSKLLFFRQVGPTCDIFQTVILTMEWYLAIFALSMVRELWSEFGPTAVLFYIFGISPVLIFIYLLPWAITTITILSYLGADMNEAEAAAVAEDVQIHLGIERTQQQQQPSSGAGVGAMKKEEAAARKLLAPAGADEWRGDVVVSLHESAPNARALDTSVPTITAGAVSGNHGANSNSSKSFKPREERPIFRPLQFDGAPLSLLLPGDDVAVVYGDGPPRQAAPQELPSELLRHRHSPGPLRSALRGSAVPSPFSVAGQARSDTPLTAGGNMTVILPPALTQQRSRSRSPPQQSLFGAPAPPPLMPITAVAGLASDSFDQYELQSGSFAGRIPSVSFDQNTSFAGSTFGRGR